MAVPRITLEFVLLIVAIIVIVLIIFFHSKFAIYIKSTFCPMMNKIIDRMAIGWWILPKLSLPHVC